jgi:HD-GYP domain-containing protein (c-di-GMP phosphodiesterase class II)
VGTRYAGRSIRRLAQVATATLLVAVCPVAVVWWLRASGTVTSAAVGVIIGMALSMGISHVGCRVWEKRPGSEDLLFNELMIWGYLHRRYTQRRLASAIAMVGPMTEAHGRALDCLSSKELAKRIERLVSGIETRDPYLHGHSRRVARHSWMIAKRMGLSREEVARIRTAAAIHDVGKVNTPRAILHKAGPLTDLEYVVIKRHPGDGAQMAEVLGDPALTSMVRHHHERLDGTGYPDALSGEEIPLGARVIAVADTFDAITSARPYRPASPHKQAIDILREEAGTRLDPAVVRAFCGHYAGRGPIALWSSLSGLPEQVLSWLGGSVASIASAAKVVAVAALVGGAAVASSTLGVPVAKQRPPNTISQSTSRSHAQSAGSTPARASVIPSALVTPTPRPSSRVRHAPVNPAVRGGAQAGPAPPAQPSQPSTVGGGAGNGTVPARSEAGGAGKGEEAHSKGEGPSGGKGEGAPKGQGGQAPTKGEEAPTKGKSEEAPSKGKSEEVPGQSGEAPGKSREAPGTPAEPAGHSEIPHGK